MASNKHTQVQQLLAAAAAACEDKKAEDIRILSLDPSESGLTDYFLICTGQSDRQNVAITDEIELRLKREFGTYPNSVEGRRQGDWILMDYVDFIVHVFSAEKRAFYGLERLRKSASVLSVEELNVQLKSKLKAAITSGRKKASEKTKKSPSSKKPAVASTAKKHQPAPARKSTKRAVSAEKTASSKSLSAKKAVSKKSAPKKSKA
ncbi:MAG: ribosome silencing factor [Acidobacteriaceae bacterium]